MEHRHMGSDAIGYGRATQKSASMGTSHSRQTSNSNSRAPRELQAYDTQYQRTSESSHERSSYTHASGHSKHSHTGRSNARATEYTSNKIVQKRPPAKRGSHSKRRHPFRIPLIILAAIILLLIIASVADALTSKDQIHHGVTVEGVDVSGLTTEEAAQKINAAFANGVATQTATIYATNNGYLNSLAQASSSDAASSVSASSGDVSSDNGAEGADESASTDAKTYLRWALNASGVGATIDAEKTAAAAFAIGHNDNFLTAWVERTTSWFSPYTVGLSINLNDDLFNEEYQKLNDSVGIAMVDVGIAYQEGEFKATQGSIGSCVDREQLRSDLKELFAKQGDHVILSMVDIPIANEFSTAQQLANTATTNTAQSFTLTYENQSWQVTSDSMGPWVHSTTTYDDQGRTGLKLTVNQDEAIKGLTSILGSAIYGSAVNAYVTVEGRKVVIHDGVEGQGPDIKSAAQQITDAICSNSTARSVSINTAVSEPKITAADIATWGITERIGYYYLNYDHGTTGTDRCYNIERALAKLNNSVIAPGETWNWNDVVGECDYSTGYRAAKVIENGVETQGAGGGICNVATGVFNAAYESCLPIVTRSNHSYYLPDYPLGRDAAVSWQYPTLVFKNDTDHYILVHADWDGSYMTISIWGTSMGRTCKSSTTDWNEYGDGSKSITNYRSVYDSNGSLLWKDSFYSWYRADPEESSSTTADTTTSTTSDSTASTSTTTNTSATTNTTKTPAA